LYGVVVYTRESYVLHSPSRLESCPSLSLSESEQASSSSLAGAAGGRAGRLLVAYHVTTVKSVRTGTDRAGGTGTGSKALFTDSERKLNFVRCVDSEHIHYCLLPQVQYLYVK